MLEATTLGLHGHFTGGFEAANTRKAFQLPDSLQPVAVIALGYLGDADQLEEPFLSREKAPRQRKPVREITFYLPAWHHASLAHPHRRARPAPAGAQHRRRRSELPADCAAENRFIVIEVPINH